jgi:DNA-binding CsgD family transcriptional regulator
MLASLLIADRSTLVPSRNALRKADLPGSRAKRLTPTEPLPLTKREREVVEWIAAGKRNREIAEILGCSSRTIQKHVQHILEKLHLETRTAVCVWWYEGQLDNERSRRRRQRADRI